MRTFIYVWGAVLVAAGCSGAPADAGDPTDATDALDAAAEAAPVAGKADAIHLDGLWATSTATSSLRAGDVPDLQLASDGTYVRARCYHARCSARIAETDAYDVFKSSGHSYLRFWTFTVVTDAQGGLGKKPVVADVYEYRRTSTGLKLRKTYTSRWLALDGVAQADLCDATGGSWSAAACACPDAGPLDTTHGAFVPGAGGCILVPGGGEDACDSSGGLYTDDETTPIGTYCECGAGRHVELGPGACAAI